MENNSSIEPLLLSPWSVTTTLADWVRYPIDLRLRTVYYARLLVPTKETLRSRWERAAVWSLSGTPNRGKPSPFSPFVGQ